MDYWAGPDAAKRAELGKQILKDRLDLVGFKPKEFRCDYVGVNAVMRELTPNNVMPVDPWEIVLRLACKDDSADMCRLLTEEIDSMAIAGPQSTGKIGTFSGRIRPVIGLTSMLVSRKDCCETVCYFET